MHETSSDLISLLLSSPPPPPPSPPPPPAPMLSSDLPGGVVLSGCLAAEPPAQPGGAACHEPGALVPGDHGRRREASAGLSPSAARQVLRLPPAGAGKALLSVSLSLSASLSLCFDSAFSLHLHSSPLLKAPPVGVAVYSGIVDYLSIFLCVRKSLCYFAQCNLTKSGNDNGTVYNQQGIFISYFRSTLLIDMPKY